jgi:HD-GYP domain-containing protein (c-di-GMP phosphodiesterase class II)
MGQVTERRTQLAGALNALVIDSRTMLEALLRMLTIGDPAMLDHGRRVADLAGLMAAELGVAEGEADVLQRAALVHDLPRLSLPESLARKEGTLLAQERELIRVGPTFGHDLLSEVAYLAEAAPIVHARYEWWDGSGYPRGLAGEAIPLSSRILAVADTFDALLQPRAYRPAMSERESAAEIVRCRGSQFDPAVVDAFCRIQPRIGIPAPAA